MKTKWLSIFNLFSAGECLRDDKQRATVEHCCLPTPFGHHAWAGNGCCISGKGVGYSTIHI